MSVIDGWRHRLRVWARPEEYAQDIDDEIRFHLALDEAHHAAPDARRRFGNVTYLREETRRTAGLGGFDALGQDVRHLGRGLRRSPGFAMVAILTLALGIGTTTAVLSIVDHVLVNALPFRDAGRLVMMLERGDNGGLRTPSAPTANDWRSDPTAREAFDGITFIRGDGVLVTNGSVVERVGAAFVSEEFFPLLGAQPVMGRVLTADDHRPGAPPVAVMSYGFWQRRFGGDRSIVGRLVGIDSVPTLVVGVLPRGAVYPDFASVWTPLSQYKHQEILARRGLHVDSRTLARLRPGVDSTRAVAAMRTVSARLAQAYPAEQARWSATMVPVRDEIVGNVKPMLLTLAAAAAAVLLLACANVANLLLSRVASRTRELAVRSALGASRRRLIRQLMTESATLAFAGGALGMALAAFAVELARKLPPNTMPRVEELTVDHRVLIVAVGASAVTALLCGVWPAFRATRGATGAWLRAGVSGSVGMRPDSRARRALVTVQFALALMLLVGAGLLVKSFFRAARVDVGFEPRGLVSMRLDMPAGAYAKPEQAAALYTRLIAAMRAVPGVEDAAFIQHFPFTGAAITTPIQVEGLTRRDTASDQVYYRTVSASYLPTMKMTMASGRWFTDDNMRSPGPSFIVNQSLASRYWPGQSAIGKRITIRRSSQARADFGQPLVGAVVGVVKDVHQTRQDVLPDPEVYVPYTLEPWPWGNLVVRTRDGARSAAQLRAALSAVDPRLLPSDNSQSFDATDDLIASALEPRKLSMSLVGAFAVCALVLAAIGLYGVIAYGVTQRTREMGVRKALGATDQMIARLVLRESLLLVGLGVVVGCVGAAATTRFMQAQLFETTTMDATAYVATIVLLTAVALLATYVPARRATRLDPTIAMRGE